MRIAIVNDSDMAVEVLRRIVGQAPHYDLAWVAGTGLEAVEQCARDTPDLILMDLYMPGMDGVEATRRIMAHSPCAILVVTSTVEGHAAKTFEALGAGALDAAGTPVFGIGEPGAGAEVLLQKIRTIGRLVGLGPRSQKRPPLPVPENGSRRAQADYLVVLGASAGGPAALATILGNLPPDFSAPIVAVQHVDAQFATSMAQWLASQCPFSVRTVVDGDTPEPGVVLMPQTNDHLVLMPDQSLRYTSHPEDVSYKPSVDTFFESVAANRKKGNVGVLLTGMGRDGARGLKALRDAGGLTIAQHEDGCVVYGMPKTAIELGAAREVIPLPEIAHRLTRLGEDVRFS